MRSHYLSDLTVQNEYVLKGDDLHHLVNVVRVETGEEILLTNGKGLQVHSQIDSVSKKELRLILLTQKVTERAFSFDVVIGIPKKEALELCIKQATELGFRTIFLVRSDYSQQRVPEEDRLQALLISALEQSNAPYLPQIISASWDDIPWGSYAEVCIMDSQSENGQRNDSRGAEKLLVIGPEGGWSPKELTHLHAKSNALVLKLPTPILRTPTALAAGAGFLLGRLLD